MSACGFWMVLVEPCVWSKWWIAVVDPSFGSWRNHMVLDQIAWIHQDSHLWFTRIHQMDPQRATNLIQKGSEPGSYGLIMWIHQDPPIWSTKIPNWDPPRSTTGCINLIYDTPFCFTYISVPWYHTAYLQMIFSLLDTKCINPNPTDKSCKKSHQKPKGFKKFQNQPKSV